jgi:predicted RND superfamily exporter protein
LAAIVAGNGINFGIYFLARYMEERTRGGEIVDRISRTLRGTFLSVSTAALAAGTAYASLMATQFKGFNQFGFIGGVGMVICLIYALTLNPALVVLMERHFPFKALSKAKHERGRIFSAASALLVTRHPRKVFWVGVVLVIASGVSLVFFLRDPFEYDFRKLRNQYSQGQGAGKRSNDAEKILGQRSSPHIFLADNVDQVPKIKEALSPYMKKDAPPEKRAIKAIRTVFDYIPGSVGEQEKKIVLLGEIRELIRGRVWKSLSPEDQKEIERLTPPEDLKPVTIDSLPEELMRPYVELDGTRGTLMYVDMTGSVWDGPSIFRFSRIIREVKLGDGKVLRSSGKVVIFNDMIRHVQTEGPWATLIAFSAVMVLLVVVYRNRRDIFVLSAAMISGVILMMGAAVALGQKINFLNYIAIPISFGIGVDYTVNLYSRFKQEGPGSIDRVLRSTGGAVMITSATTILGFGAMWFSINGAINSFATLAVLGEVTALATATIFAPAAFALFLKGLPPKA